MTPDPNARWPERDNRAKSLTKLLEENEHIKDLVKQSAEELSWVITGIKQALANRDPLPGVEVGIGSEPARDSPSCPKQQPRSAPMTAHASFEGYLFLLQAGGMRVRSAP